MSKVEEIQREIERLQSQLDGFKKNARTKIDKMSSEVKDTNPYSRLMALQRMGIVNEYERIRSKSVAVVGELSWKLMIQGDDSILCNSRCWWSWICDSRYVDQMWNRKIDSL